MRLGIFFQGLSCCFQGVYKVYKGYQGISGGFHGLLGFFKGFQDQWPMTNRSNDMILEIRCDQAGPDLSEYLSCNSHISVQLLSSFWLKYHKLTSFIMFGYFTMFCKIAGLFHHAVCMVK